jgi:hypothetical protein
MIASSIVHDIAFSLRMQFTFNALSASTGNVAESLTFTEQVGTDRSKLFQVCRTTVSADFVAPILQMSATSVVFKYVTRIAIYIHARSSSCCINVHCSLPRLYLASIHTFLAVLPIKVGVLSTTSNALFVVSVDCMHDVHVPAGTCGRAGAPPL